LNIIGRYNETTKQLDAKVIKNNTIQMLGVANKVGIVDTIDSANMVLTLHRQANDKKNYTITANTATKYYKKTTASSTLQVASFSDIKTGDRIRARGVLNRKSLNISANSLVVLP
jgi:hypothetical protein